MSKELTYEELVANENSDKLLVAMIKSGITMKGGYCPCLIEKSKDTLCPCTVYKETRKCHCGLYVR